MEYEFLDHSIEREHIILPNSDKINQFLLKNNYEEIIKAVDFIASEEKFLYVHGFMGTGKRQFINYVSEFLSRDVIKLEYYCKKATVCDDILLSFIDTIENQSISRALNINQKISTLSVKFHQMISSIRKPFLIILHSLDEIQDENVPFIADALCDVIKEDNVKIIISTRALKQDVLGDLEVTRKIFLKALKKDIFKEFLVTNQINFAERTFEDFYKYTRGYYYYEALTVKILQAMKIDLSEFLQKFAQSGMTFDSYLGNAFVNLVPTAIRNFFWFLRTVRHGLTLNALAVFEIYDEFSVEYLKNNLMIFQSGETIYVQDYFLQKIDITIPQKTEIRLHKYIIGLYETQLKESLKNRIMQISRQAMRAEIEYHKECIYNLEHAEEIAKEEVSPEPQPISQTEAEENTSVEISIADRMKSAQALVNDKKYTNAIEEFLNILSLENIDLPTVIEARVNLARLYKQVGDFSKASHYYELVETYYKQHKEFINLNYLYYDMTDLYYKMYKHERAVETIKKVIYSVDTPQFLMVNACTLLGNIYSDINNPNEAYSYYKKALESLDENVDASILSELYFKYALANDDRGMINTAFEYYNKCISIVENNSFRALAYSNMASCYYDNESYDDAMDCFMKAYDIEKSNNNYDGIYYNSYHIAKIYLLKNSTKALEYLIEAKRSAEFINEEFYILEASIALGDYYYNRPENYKDSLKEYFKARKLALHIGQTVDIKKIETRINDMKLRMSEEDFNSIEIRYGK